MTQSQNEYTWEPYFNHILISQHVAKHLIAELILFMHSILICSETKHFINQVVTKKGGKNMTELVIKDGWMNG